MTPETLQALKGSIEKWEKIVAGTGEDDGPQNCPLCLMFHKRMRMSSEMWEAHMDDDGRFPVGLWMCEGCPVAEKVGNVGCADTPYEEFFDLQADEDWNPSGLNERKHLKAIEELEFLKSLLPIETKS